MVWFKKYSQNPNPKMIEANRYELVLNADQYCQCLTLITLVSTHSYIWNYSVYTSQKQGIAWSTVGGYLEFVDIEKPYAIEG